MWWIPVIPSPMASRLETSGEKTLHWPARNTGGTSCRYRISGIGASRLYHRRVIVYGLRSGEGAMMAITNEIQQSRLDALRRQIKAAEMDCLALVPGFNLHYLTGQEFFLLERPFITFIPADESAPLVVVIPKLEAPAWESSIPFEARLIPWTVNSSTPAEVPCPHQLGHSLAVYLMASPMWFHSTPRQCALIRV